MRFQSLTAVEACQEMRTKGITCYRWCRKFASLKGDQVRHMKGLEQVNLGHSLAADAIRASAPTLGFVLEGNVVPVARSRRADSRT
jgi:hypothetical protein